MYLTDVSVMNTTIKNNQKKFVKKTSGAVLMKRYRHNNGKILGGEFSESTERRLGEEAVRAFFVCVSLWGTQEPQSNIIGNY